jgi:hypothetical protein
MRILLSCLQSLKRHPVPAYEYWRLYFTKGCEEAGIELVEVPGVDWVEGLVYPPGGELNRWHARTWEAVLTFVRSEHVRRPLDFFLGYLYPQQIAVTAITELQRMGIPCVNFFCDNVREFHQVPEEYRPFALHWVPEYEALPMYRKAGLPHLHAPMPCWIPSELRKTPALETEPPTFLGSPDVLRRDLLGRALNYGAEFVVRGPGWTNAADKPAEPARSFNSLIVNQIKFVQTQGFRGLCCKVRDRLQPLAPPAIDASKLLPPVYNEDYLRITRESMVTIGVNRVPTARRSNRNPLTYSRLRDLEAPMLGACYLTEWTAGLGDLYELGKEIETYRTPEELAAKVKELRNDTTRRRLLRERGQKRALADHSVNRSLDRIRQRLSL